MFPGKRDGALRLAAQVVADGDGVTNVVDVVRMVTHVLGGDQLGGVGGCQADVNGDGVINVVDIVIYIIMIVNA